MVFALLSPAKTLQFDPVLAGLAASVVATPYFQRDAARIVKTLQAYDVTALARLMAISPKLAALNAERFQMFKAKPTAHAVTAPAILAYRGDVYQGFDVDTLTPAQVRFAHDHLGLLTGLYGILQPLDAMQAYRLEMSTPLPIGTAPHLYSYWGRRITDRINQLASLAKATAIIGLASQEYLKAVQLPHLHLPFIQCDFKHIKNGKLQIVALFAKKARGMLARYIVTEKITKPDDLKNFTLGDYAFAAKLSTPQNFVFIR